MAKLGLKLQLELNSYCYAFVARRFAMFCNEKHRGSGFNWDSFPEMMAESAPIFAGTAVTYRHENKRAEIEEYLADLALYFAVEMVKEAGFVVFPKTTTQMDFETAEQKM